MDSNQLLHSLSESLGVPELRFDDNGCARLATDGAPAINFERDPAGTIHAYSVLATLPAEGREALYEQLLQGNLFGAATSGAALAVDTGGNEVLLCGVLATKQTTPELFAAQFEHFVGAAQKWQAQLARTPEAAET